MENTSRLHDTLMEVHGQHRNWLDKRHLKTLVWIVNGMLWSDAISLTEWAPYTIRLRIRLIRRTNPDISLIKSARIR